MLAVAVVALLRFLEVVGQGAVAHPPIKVTPLTAQQTLAAAVQAALQAIMAATAALAS